MGGHQNYNFESLQDALNNIKRSNTFETPEVRYTFETPEAKRAMIEMFEAGLRKLRKFRDLRARTDPAGDLRRDEEEGERLGDTGDGGYTSPMWPHRRSWIR